MQTTQKAGDPSMDEILASIRKIIADDPAVAPSSAHPPVPPARVEKTHPSQVVASATPAAVPVRSERRGPSALDQELAELLREPADPPAPAFAAATALPLLGSAPIAPAGRVPLADAGDKAATTGLGGWFRNRPNGAVTGAAVPSDETHHVSAQQRAPQTGTVASPPVVVAAVPEAMPPSPAIESPAPVSMQSILNRLGAAGASAPGPQPAPSPAPIPESVISPVSAHKPMPAGAQPEQPPTAPANRPQAEASAAPSSAEKAAEPVPAAIAEAVAMPAPLPVPAPAAVAEAPMAPQAAATPQRPEPVAPAETGAARQPVAEQPKAAMGEEKSLDDTLAELLRPVVRQWLDENMARALEKAVKIEMADSVKSAMTKLVPGAKS